MLRCARQGMKIYDNRYNRIFFDTFTDTKSISQRYEEYKSFVNSIFYTIHRHIVKEIKLCYLRLFIVK